MSSKNTKDTSVKPEVKAAGPQSLQILRSSNVLADAPSPLPFGTPALIANATGDICKLFIGDAGNNPVEIGGSNFAKILSPTFEGTPAAPTAAVNTNTTQIATTEFVNIAINNAITSSEVTAGAGLTETSGTFDVNVDNSTIEIDGITNEVQIKDAGITIEKFASGVANQNNGIDILPAGLSVKVDHNTIDFSLTGEVEVADEGITGAKLADGAVTNSKIYNGSVTNDKLAVNSVDTPQITGGSITFDKLSSAIVDPNGAIIIGANGLAAAVDGATIGINVNGLTVVDGGINTTQLANGAVTLAKLNTTGLVDGTTIDIGANGFEVMDGAISTAKIQDNAVTIAKINTTGFVDGTTIDIGVNGLEVMNGAISTAKIQDQAVTANKIADASVSITKIDTNGFLPSDSGLTIDNATGLNVNVDGNTIIIDSNELKVKDQGIGTAQIADVSVTTQKITANAVTAAQLASQSVSIAKIDTTNFLATNSGLTIDNVNGLAVNVDNTTIDFNLSNELEVKDGSITSAKIGLQAIQGVNIAPGAVGTIQLADNSVTIDKLNATGFVDGVTIDIGASGLEVMDNAISTAKIQNNAVTTGKIADQAVTGSKIAQDAVGTLQIINQAVTLAKVDTTGFVQVTSGLTMDYINGIAINSDNLTIYSNGSDQLAVKDGGISNAKLADAAVTGNKIGLQTIEGVNIAPGAIGTLQIADDSVTIDKIDTANFVDGTTINIGANGLEVMDNAISTAKIQDDAVTSAKIADNAVGTLQIANNSVTIAKLNTTGLVDGTTINIGANGLEVMDNAISTAKVQDNAITSSKIATDAVTSAQIAAGAVNAAELGNVVAANGGLLGGGSAALSVNVDTTTIALNTNGEVAVLDGGINTAQLADNAVTSAKILDGAITSTKIVAGAVGTIQLADNAVTTAKIQDNAVTIAKIDATGFVDETTIDIGANGLEVKFDANGGLKTDVNGLAVNVDNTTIDINATTHLLEVKDSGISAAKLGAVIAASNSGLTGGNGAALSVHALSIANATSTNAAAITVGANGIGVAVDNLTINATGTGALEVKNGGISTIKIIDEAVTTSKIADVAVTTDKIADNAITSAKIANGAVNISELGNVIMADGGLLGGNGVGLSVNVDNSTIELNLAGEVEVKDGGITFAKLSTTNFVDANGGLTIGANGLAVNVDNVSIVATGGVLSAALIDCGTF